MLVKAIIGASFVRARFYLRVHSWCSCDPHSFFFVVSPIPGEPDKQESTIKYHLAESSSRSKLINLRILDLICLVLFIGPSVLNTQTHILRRIEDRKESRGLVTSRGRTRVALLRLALCYSVVPLRSNLYLTKIERNHWVLSHREEGPGSHCLD